MNLEKNLAEDKNFALLTQDVGAEVRRLAAPMKKHIQAWACSPRNSARQANFGDPETAANSAEGVAGGVAGASRCRGVSSACWLDKGLEYARETF